MMARTLKGFEIRVLGQSPRAGRFAGFSLAAHGWFSSLLSGALAGLAGISRCRPDRPAAARHLAGLRLHRHHRRLPRPAESARHHLVAGLSWR
jgi:ribose/xylose/arabinose/galactoside ABC-type transport system permease subunit